MSDLSAYHKARFKALPNFAKHIVPICHRKMGGLQIKLDLHETSVNGNSLSKSHKAHKAFYSRQNYQAALAWLQKLFTRGQHHPSAETGS